MEVKKVGEGDLRILAVTQVPHGSRRDTSNSNVSVHITDPLCRVSGRLLGTSCCGCQKTSWVCLSLWVQGLVCEVDCMPNRGLS